MFNILRVSRSLSIATALLACLTCAVASAQSSTRTETGELDAADPRLGEGEYYDRYDVEGIAGEQLVVELRSADFDTFVQVHPVLENGRPDWERESPNHDDDGSHSRSRQDIPLPVTGTYAILVTTYEARETGRYELAITTTNGRVESGKLSYSDLQLGTGEFYDVYELTARAGENWVLDLASDDFDTYLYVRCPDDASVSLDNDDHRGDAHRSQITLQAPRDGLYLVYVTSFQAGEVGQYRLTFSGGESAAPVADGTRRLAGQLDSSDDTLTNGEYFESHELTGVPGQHVRIELSSSDFDTYLLLIDPLGDPLANDDFNGETHRSVIDTELSEAGTYSVVVTSYGARETGDYELSIEASEATPSHPAEDVEHLLASGTERAELEADDVLDDRGRLTDLYSFEATAGDRVIIDMSSLEFDPLLVLTMPDGRSLEFDDFGGGQNARIDLEVEQTGRYRVTATSYGTLVTGGYTLDIELGDSETAPAAPQPVIVAEGRRVLGVFVGIADYEGDDSDLPNCDQDAQTLYDIFTRQFGMAREDAVLLTNDEATMESVMEAVERIGRRAGPDDMLIFFYSGHGSQFEGTADSQDPDGVHETLNVFDGDISDDDFAAAINTSDAGLCLVVLDSCLSGGFAKDVVSAAGRMGIFSSEEDVLSAVPDKFVAGGYLSRFFAEAISDRRELADTDHNHQLTAFELSDYLHERYNDEVRSTKRETQRGKGGDGYVNVTENLSYQRLVIDRSGIRHDQVLFRW